MNEVLCRIGERAQGTICGALAAVKIAVLDGVALFGGVREHEKARR